MSKRIYISGPISGMPGNNREAFDAVEKRLSALDYEPVNPHKLFNLEEEGFTWKEFMKRDIKELLECDEVVTLPGWEGSTGASLEVHIAKQLDMPCMPALRFFEIMEKNSVRE